MRQAHGAAPARWLKLSSARHLCTTTKGLKARQQHPASPPPPYLQLCLRDPARLGLPLNHLLGWAPRGGCICSSCVERGCP